MMKEYPSSLTFRFIISGFVFDSCSLYLCSRSSLHLHISRLPAREGFSWRKWQFFLKRIFGLEFFLLIFTSEGLDRKSTRLNSSHVKISYAVFCLKKKSNLNVLEL